MSYEKQTDIDVRYMRHALLLGARGLGVATPNPCVGCVIVNHGRIVGRGWTQAGGRPHGEFMALSQAGDLARGATLYTTLEPCAHVSPRGPSCSDQLIAAGVSRVVMAMIDPDPRTAGQGQARLEAAGISTLAGVCAVEARDQLRAFIQRLALGRPWVTLKLAITLDGFTAQADGTSQWITGDAARQHAHLMRSQQDALIVGHGTVLADNPRLDVRLPGLEARAPVPIILSHAATAAPAGSHLAKNPKTRVANAKDIPAFLSKLASDGMLHVLVEGGADTAARFLAADMVDEVHLYRAPVLLGQGRHMSAFLDARQLSTAHGLWHIQDTRQLGVDELTLYRRIRSTSLHVHRHHQ
jgi:diaminohydroxyphosphoribosylaminopyrimidine deaminase / 5-amino-6-(5-phosphoribosylamino)uracil reductase